MHASLPKQVAYNQRILKAGAEIDGINCDLAEFLTDMNLNPEVPVIVCVDPGESFKKHEQHIGGQLWIQGSRKMTATNVLLPDMKNEASSAALVAIAEAVEWKHAFEPIGEKRKGQRVVIYPPTLDKLEEVLPSGDISLDPEPRPDVAYNKIFEAYMPSESPPRFYRSDSPELGALGIAEKVPLSMHTAKQISIRGRRQVLEDGADVCDSESDSENDVHIQDPG
jgi:hypothetical protein